MWSFEEMQERVFSLDVCVGGIFSSVQLARTFVVMPVMILHVTVYFIYLFLRTKAVFTNGVLTNACFIFSAGRKTTEVSVRLHYQKRT